MHKALLVMLACAVSSCENVAIAPGDQGAGPLLFEIEYVNFAWGYAYEGIVVGDDGNLYSYNPGAEQVAVLHHADERYTAAELRSKHGHRKALIRAVSQDTLASLRGLVGAVRVGDTSDTTNAGADMGAVTYSVYRYDTAESKYKRVILRVDGDWTFHNRSEAAIALVEVMRGL